MELLSFNVLSVLRRRCPRPPWVVLATMAMCSVAVRVAGAPSPSVHESDVKAAFLYNFARFVSWPDAPGRKPDDPITIGIVTGDPFNGTLDAIVRGEKVEGHPIVIRRFTWHDDVSRCDLLYVTSAEAVHLKEILARVHGRPILTVSDVENFARNGGAIGLVNRGGKVKFQINLQQAKQAGLVVSAKLLRVADIVPDQPQSRVPLPVPAFVAADEVAFNDSVLPLLLQRH